MDLVELEAQTRSLTGELLCEFCHCFVLNCLRSFLSKTITDPDALRPRGINLFITLHEDKVI